MCGQYCQPPKHMGICSGGWERWSADWELWEHNELPWLGALTSRRSAGWSSYGGELQSIIWCLARGRDGDGTRYLHGWEPHQWLEFPARNRTMRPVAGTITRLWRVGCQSTEIAPSHGSKDCWGMGIMIMILSYSCTGPKAWWNMMVDLTVVLPAMHVWHNYWDCLLDPTAPFLLTSVSGLDDSNDG